MGAPARPRRYDQCDDTCTVDCGHCKGAGQPPAPVEPHCPSCTCGRRAPVQRDSRRGENRRGAGTVSWAEHLAAYAIYSGRNGNSQSPERIAERQGFGYSEITDLLGHEPTTWQPR